MNPRRPAAVPSLLILVLACLLASGCADRDHRMVISVPEQRMVLLRRGQPLATYPVSTSKFGLGDRPGSNGTPLGEMEVAKKIGAGAPLGAVFKGREPTGEVLRPDAPGRDPIVTRILWLRGLSGENQNAFDRYIYIHGTPEERNIGQRASYGCVRMRSRDVAALFDTVGNGARVTIRDESMLAAVTPYLQLPKGQDAATLFAAAAPPPLPPASASAVAVGNEATVAAGASSPPPPIIAR